MKKYSILIFSIILVSCGSCNDQNVSSTPSDVDSSIVPPVIPNIPFTITAQYPHDTSAFTEGLQFYKGKLYEGTGMENNSSLRITNLKTGAVEKKYQYADPLIFGEGIQVFKGKIYQLTWKNNIVYVFNENDISKPIKTFTWPYQGWGMTNNGTNLLISDGSANIYTVNPDDFKVIRKISVNENGSLIANINELEYVNGFIFANIWDEDKKYILKIDASNGNVVGKMMLGDLRQQYFTNPEKSDILNGIAFDSTTQKMYITGKYWPKIFEITFP